MRPSTPTPRPRATSARTLPCAILLGLLLAAAGPARGQSASPTATAADVLPRGPAPPPAGCRAGDATTNEPRPLLWASYDFVPVGPVADLGFWQVYSVRGGPDGEPVVWNNVSITVYELADDHVLVFGAGYGSQPFPPPMEGGAPLFDAAFDMAMVDEVVRSCMGLTAPVVRVDLVAPHGHVDHVNPDATAALRELGYDVRRIVFHEADGPLVSALPGWTPDDVAVFAAATGADCGPLETPSGPLRHDAPLGEIWFRRRAGHTPGSVDLVIDVGGDPSGRWVVLGSTPGGACTLPGVQQVLKAHGNAVLGD